MAHLHFTGLRENLFSEIDMENTIVVEFPAPPVVNSSGKIVYYPRLALGTLGKYLSCEFTD